MDIDVLLLVFAAFCAGFVDAVAGGGGLIQVPALLAILPDMPVATLFGTNKISSIFGTASATWRYMQRVAIPWAVTLPAAGAAFVFSFFGAASVAWFPVELVRPVVLVLLVFVVVYVFLQPQIGLAGTWNEEGKLPIWRALFLGATLGFYDGFFGPGTGSFLVFGFVRFFGMGFLGASGAAKVVNLSTNAAALSFFLPAGNVLLLLGVLMASANVVGALMGARAALRGGNAWVRRFFLIVSVSLIIKIASDMF